MKMLGRLIGGFFALNILLILLGFFIIFWKVEAGAGGIVKIIEDQPSYLQATSYEIASYQVIEKEDPLRGFKLPNILGNIIQGRWSTNYFESRAIEKNRPDKKTGFLEGFDYISYNMKFIAGGKAYHIKYILGPDFRLFLNLLTIILIVELIIIIGDIRKGARTIRATLKPISELSETAKNLNARVRSMSGGNNDRHIKDLAGAISNIDANKLDKGISIDSTQDELKDLASAINNMLNRINASYQSQIRFVSDASHELRTPISVIQGYVNLLDRWGKEDKKTMEESIGAIKAETQSMKDLVEQLLFLARGDNETIQLHRESFDICEIVGEIIYETQMIDPDHVFDMDLNRPAYINGDKQLIKQAIRILVDNSIKYTTRGKKIILKVIREGDHVKVIVQDQGIGIAPKDIPQIFDRFYRSDESRARQTGGSGLGLSIARWIIQRHGGHFEALSRLDIGTRITIILEKGKQDLDKEDTYS